MRLYIYYMLGVFMVYSTGCNSKASKQSSTTIAESKSMPETPTITDTITDYDGNLYTTLKIGSQVWMASNLKVTHYNNGEPIAYVKEDTKWRALTTGAYCNYNNDKAHTRIYGVLYNWHAVIDPRRLAPKGWHVPNEQEWKALIAYLGGNNTAGCKLKATGTTYWEAPNNTATNQSGFNALPAGDRNNNGIYGNKAFSATWWSASGEQDADFATNFGVISGSMGITQDTDDRVCGISVRCVRD